MTMTNKKRCKLRMTDFPAKKIFCLLLISALAAAALAGCGPSLAEIQRREQAAIQEQRRQAETARRTREEQEHRQLAEREEKARREAALKALREEEERGRVEEASARVRSAFSAYMKTLGQTPPENSADRLRLQESVIRVALKLDPPPAVPEEARRHGVRGMAALEAAGTGGDYRRAMDELRQALLHAPWLGDAWYNLALVAEKSEEYSEAITAFRMYLLATPAAPDREAITNRIYSVEFRMEEKNRQLAERDSWKGKWVTKTSASMTFDVHGEVTRETQQRWAPIFIEIRSIADSGDVRARLAPGLWQSRCLDGTLGDWSGRLTEGGVILKLPPGSRNLENRDVTTSRGGELQLSRQGEEITARLTTSCDYASPGMLGGEYRSAITFTYQGPLGRQGK